jgi:hypothetical protein
MDRDDFTFEANNKDLIHLDMIFVTVICFSYRENKSVCAMSSG